MQARNSPGEIRDAILASLELLGGEASITEIQEGVSELIGHPVPASSVRSYLQLNTPTVFTRTGRGRYTLGAVHEEAGVYSTSSVDYTPVAEFGRARLFQADCLAWLRQQDSNSIHAVVTDPPYGLVEYTASEQAKLRAGRGGVWRIPPSFDGHTRSPLPRFTTLTRDQLSDLFHFFQRWSRAIHRVLVPGGHVFIASNPLVSYMISQAAVAGGFERRGEIIRLVMTMRGGDRPKNAHEEFSDVSVMPRSMWEPWLLFRKPLEGRVQDNLRKWKTGGLRRISDARPFGDVIKSQPTRTSEKKIAPHPSLKPQAFLRQIVRASLPLGEGIVLDPFAGSGSTLAAANAVGYESIGVEIDPRYVEIARTAVSRLAEIMVKEDI
ncbi:MAG TPA: site-specific DNA-methyltransferase [Rhodothermales bacterium]|nr:site-specific DNA-methyltransferase [Rhodothermales bacterium]